MVSNGIDDEKPNLRPTKFSDANGKSLGTCCCLIQSWGGSSIQATLNTPSKYRNRNGIVFDQPGLLGIDRPSIQYSLHKRKRWELLDDIQTSLYTSECEFSRQRSYSTSTLPQETYHIKIDSYPSERYRKQTRKPLSLRLTMETSKAEGHTESFHTCMDDSSQAETAADGITYWIDISTRRKQIRSIRTNHRNNIRGQYRLKKDSHLTKEQSHDYTEELSSDDDDFLNAVCSRKINPLQLNDFLPRTTEKLIQSKSPQKHRIDRPRNQFFHPTNRKREIYYEYSTTTVPRRSVPPTQKISRHFMSLSFRSVALERAELTEEYLSNIYGKDFTRPHSSPAKYLICLTSRLQSFSSANSYLVLVLNENTTTDQEICYGQVGVNIDLNAEAFGLTNLLASDEKVYRVAELIERAIELLKALPIDVFERQDMEMSQRKLAKDGADRRLSDIEFLNKQIQQVQLLNSVDLQTNASDSIRPRPTTCPICCQDTNAMTALQGCGHWLCDNCWKQYLESSIDHVKLIGCPEWNCPFAVDAGTILSLVNVRCLTIYERHIETCLLNSSRSYIRCPLASCSNIIPISDLSTPNCVRCRCGHQFCRDCKQEAHFPATCLCYLVYMEIAKKNGYFNSNSNATTTVVGQKCISCNYFIEKNGGCNHMTCRCGAQFCWNCGGYWNDHLVSAGVWRCPKATINLETRTIVEDASPSKHLFASAIHHRQQRTPQVQAKLKENAKRLIETIPIDIDALSDAELHGRQALVEHCYQMVEYVRYLHQICEFTCVSAQGYLYQPKEFFNSLRQLEVIICNFTRVFESGRGHSAMEQLNQLCQRSEALIQRLRHAVRLRRTNISGYITS